MSLKETAELLARGEQTMRNLAAAQTNARLTFRPYSENIPDAFCRNCNTSRRIHVQETGILFCPEWALQEVYGR